MARIGVRFVIHRCTFIEIKIVLLCLFLNSLVHVGVNLAHKGGDPWEFGLRELRGRKKDDSLVGVVRLAHI